MRAIAGLAALTLALLPASAAGSKPLKVALVTDVLTKPSQRDVRGLQYLGFLRGVRELRITGRVVQVKPQGDPVDTLASLARQKYDLIFTGIAPSEDVERVARRFPLVRFAISYPWEVLSDRPKNVLGVDFRIEQAGYLAGYLAALLEKRRPGKDVIGSVGGVKFPGVDGWIAGYQAGARKADPGIMTLNGYSNDFLNPAKCKAVALGQIERGAGVVFQVAGLCGLGTLEAARERGVWGIGVDGDESYLGPHILTSAIRRDDIAVYRTIEALVQGRLRTGESSHWNLANGGVGLGKVSPKVPPSMLAQVDKVRAQIVAGKIHVPSTLGR